MEDGASGLHPETRETSNLKCPLTRFWCRRVAFFVSGAFVQGRCKARPYPQDHAGDNQEDEGCAQAESQI